MIESGDCAISSVMKLLSSAEIARTGRACDYDLQRLPRSKLAIREDKMQLRDPTLTVKDGFWWAMTTDKRRCYSYFQHRTVLALSDSFDSRL
jgi:hypothetical protein